jgi:hypothetical protein
VNAVADQAAEDFATSKYVTGAKLLIRVLPLYKGSMRSLMKTLDLFRASKLPVPASTA